MVERKVKSTNQRDGGFKGGKRKNLGPIKKKGKKDEARDKRPRRGPRLPNALQRELGNFKRAGDAETSDVDEEIDSDEEVIGNDVYEYEEGVPEEESMKNRRFDPVENYEYELSENFEDYKVSSGSEDDDDLKESDNEDEDEGKHSRMLEEITGLPSDAFGGKKKKDFFVSEAYPESEFNPTRDIIDGSGQITIEDLLEPLQGKPGFSKLRKSLNRLEKKTAPTLAPLPKTEQERLERKVAYEHSKKEITKWEPLVKRNREASTLFFDNNVDLQFSTIGAISSDFEPRTDFEKKMASLVNENEFVEAHNRDGARLLELNKISAEEVKERQERLAKMRSLLFRHELKAKRVKKIKSKTYHRLLKKDKKKAAESAIQMDPESAKAQALKQEFDRLRERMTLKHKNNSKWAKRVLQRGLDVQDEGTREAFAQQLSQHRALTRKQNSMRESSSSDDSSDGDDSDDTSAGSDQDMASKLITKAKEKTLKVLEGDEELPESGVYSLNFMKRGLKKRREAADEEARLAVEEYESSLRQLEDKSAPESSEKGASSGRMVFGVPKKVVKEKRKVEKMNNYYGNSDSEDDVEAEEDNVIEQNNQNDKSLIEADIDPNILREEFDIAHDSVFKSFGGAEDPEPKTTYEVSFLASDKWQKMNQSSGDAIKKDKNTVPKKDRVRDAIKEDRNIGRKKKKVTFETMEHDIEENDDGSDSDEEMVDGILSSGPKSTYELPSQAELIQRAFAGDDVEEDFKKDKEEILDEENPQPEKPALIPGWGQWTDVQKKRGLPLWMVKEHETAKKQRMEALKKRKDARLNNVIISEKVDKKAEKLHTKTLPYPYTSKEVFEQSIRMPIGPDFNPATSLGALNRPEVVKRPGLIILPISYEDMNVRERAEIKKRSGQKPNNAKNNNSRSAKKSTAKA